MINNSLSYLQQKREQFALNMKRIDRETLFSNNRKRMRDEGNQLFEVNQILHLLNGAITIYNKKGIKTYLKMICDFNQLEKEQEIKIIKLIEVLLKVKIEEDNSAIHNDCLNVLVQMSLHNTISVEIFHLLPIIYKLIEKYNSHINQALSYSIIDKMLAFIGNISCNNGFVDTFSQELITILVYQIQFGQKRLLFQTLWALNNILFALHNETVLLNQVLIQIGQTDLPQYLIQYMKKNENKLEKNQLVSIYWLYAELSQAIPYDIAELQIQEGENTDLTLILLLIYTNLTGQKITPKNCNIEQLLNLFYTSTSQLIQRQILVILSNLVLLIDVDVQQIKHLINYSFPLCPIDSMFLLHNCQTKYSLKFETQETEAIFRIISELQTDPIVEQLVKQLQLNN